MKKIFAICPVSCTIVITIGIAGLSSHFKKGGTAMKNLVLAFANNLKMLREEKGLTLRGLAEELDISKSALHQYENAMADPSLTSIKKIAAYFHEDINWLIGETPVRRIKKIASGEN